MEILSDFHHLLALVSHWNVTASCQDIKPVLSQLTCANKYLFKSPLVLTSPLLDSPRGEPQGSQAMEFSHLLQAPLAVSFLTAST